MNPNENQILINQQSWSWHERLTSALSYIWRGIVWWFTDTKAQRLHLKRWWEIEMESIDLLGIDQREW